MTKITTGFRGLKPHIVGARVGLGLMAILMVAFTPALIVLAIAQTKPVSAATQTAEDSTATEVAAELTEDRESDMAEVWCDTLTAVYNSDSTTTYLGYTPAQSPSSGSVDDTPFTYEGEDCTT